MYSGESVDQNRAIAETAGTVTRNRESTDQRRNVAVG